MSVFPSALTSAHRTRILTGLGFTVELSRAVVSASSSQELPIVKLASSGEYQTRGIDPSPTVTIMCCVDPVCVELMQSATSLAPDPVVTSMWLYGLYDGSSISVRMRAAERSEE